MKKHFRHIIFLILVICLCIIPSYVYADDPSDNYSIRGLFIEDPESVSVSGYPGAAVVSWSIVNDAEGYMVSRQTDSGNYEIVAIETGTGYIDTDLEAGHYYTYVVKAYKNTPDNKENPDIEPDSAWLSYYCIPSGEYVTWIGDSYSVFGAGNIYAYFPGAAVYARISKAADWDTGGGNTSGISILRAIINEGVLRPYLVFALGTNHSAGSMTSVVNTVMSMVGPDIKVIFVTARTLYEYRIAANNELKTAVSWYPNAIVADWAAVCRDSYFADNAHLNSYGLWVNTIYNAFYSPF